MIEAWATDGSRCFNGWFKKFQRMVQDVSSYSTSCFHIRLVAPESVTVCENISDGKN